MKGKFPVLTISSLQEDFTIHALLGWNLTCMVGLLRGHLSFAFLADMAKPHLWLYLPQPAHLRGQVEDTAIADVTAGVPLLMRTAYVINSKVHISKSLR